MENIDDLFKDKNIDNVISSLKNNSIEVPSWEKLSKEYYPEKHNIVDDKLGREDKIKSNGHVEKAARIALGLERLLTKRTSEFTFAIPVKRIFTNTDTDERKQIAEAIESVFTSNHINTVNLNRGIAYYASCQIFTLWYTVQKKNTIYGFDSEYKLKCKTFSPMDGVKLYALLDEYDDMIAMSFEYEKKIADERTIFFETFTSDRHYKWKQKDGQKGWETVKDAESIIIEKIPGIFLSRMKPVWDGLCVLRENLEYTISRDSDVIAYNAAPILKVSGNLVGEEKKGESRRVYRVTEGGDVAYVSWQQAIEAVKYHSDTLIKLYFMQAQIPDISFENLKSLGNIGYDARKTLLADAHLKIGEESGAWIEFFEREVNVIKAFLKKMNTRWKEEDVDAVKVEHVITPFVQEDEAAEINKWITASGGKPIVSQLDAIKNSNLTDNADETYERIQQEERTESANRALGMSDMFT